jgi:hypothetical protein
MAGVIFDGKTVAPAILVEKEIVKKKFGASIDDMLGDEPTNGYYSAPSEPFTVDMSKIKGMNGIGMPYLFYYKNVVGTIDLRNYELQVQRTSLQATFAYTKVETVYLPLKGDPTFTPYLDSTFEGCSQLTTVYIQGTDISGIDFNNTFSNCSALTTIVGLEDVKKIGSIYGAFSYSGLSGVLRFNSLEEITDDCSNAFSYTDITAVYFPKLTTLGSTSALGSASYVGIFNGCSALTEIHFRADMQSQIESQKAYSRKFGATSSTIYFDL